MLPTVTTSDNRSNNRILTRAASACTLLAAPLVLATALHAQDTGEPATGSLADRLDSLEKGGVVGQVVAEEQVPAVKEGSEGEVGQHTTSPEFAYMAGLVKELKGRVGELQGQMQAQLRQNLQDSDKLREMARKVNLAETSLKQARLAV